MNSLAYFNRDTKWEDVVGFSKENHYAGGWSRVYFYKFRDGKWAKSFSSLEGERFHARYRIIYAEDFAEERERLLKLLQSTYDDGYADGEDHKTPKVL